MATLGETTLIHLEKLNFYHKNPKRGDIQAIAESLRTNGQFRPIVVNKGTHTGRPYETLAGNHTLKAFHLLHDGEPDNPNWFQVECYLIDVDEDSARRILLADNRTADLGTYDNDILLELLDELDDDLGLEGTGYTDDYVDCLLGANTPETQLEEDDTKTEGAYMPYSIVVECRDETEQRRLLERFIEEGLECRAVM